MWLIKLVQGYDEVGYYETTDHGQMWVCFDKFPNDDKTIGKLDAIALCSKLNGGS